MEKRVLTSDHVTDPERVSSALSKGYFHSGDSMFRLPLGKDQRGRGRAATANGVLPLVDGRKANAAAEAAIRVGELLTDEGPNFEEDPGSPQRSH